MFLEEKFPHILGKATRGGAILSLNGMELRCEHTSFRILVWPFLFLYWDSSPSNVQRRANYIKVNLGETGLMAPRILASSCTRRHIYT